jgi:hypothetical protein
VRSLRFPPALRGFRLAIAPAASPAFGRYASCKPGDPPPPGAPRHCQSLEPYPVAIEAPYRGFPSERRQSCDYYRQFHLNEAQDTFTGELATLEVGARKVTFRPNEAKADTAP